MSLLIRNNLISYGHKFLPASYNLNCRRKILKRCVHTPGVIKSPLGKVNIPVMSLPQYVWKNWEKWEDDPAAVS